jgi:hypothetical protein
MTSVSEGGKANFLDGSDFAHGLASADGAYAVSVNPGWKGAKCAEVPLSENGYSFGPQSRLAFQTGPPQTRQRKSPLYERDMPDILV